MYLPGPLCSIIFLLYSWGSRCGVPSKVPLLLGSFQRSAGLLWLLEVKGLGSKGESQLLCFEGLGFRVFAGIYVFLSFRSIRV